VTGAPGELAFRPLRAEDAERLFRPGQEALVQEWLTRQEGGGLYVAVAELDGVPVGRRCLDFTYYAGQGIAYCFAASVQPEWRSRGIGSMLDRHLAEVAHARGCHTLRCVAAKHNDGAVRWHERIGDRRTGECVASWTEPDGREKKVECWRYERPLGQPSESGARDA